MVVVVLFCVNLCPTSPVPNVSLCFFACATTPQLSRGSEHWLAERLLIVGRQHAGKTSLCSALFRRMVRAGALSFLLCFLRTHRD